ncbi:DUF1289 domain-containing protein [Variovorax arabinosiphilus]|uniref:DUF1289 domain-containing protein n=1 Tax=Variovorax arabinosiphilus TaxID=3053498 RepID=UPI0025780E16|nr:MULTISPECIES: DUF1289 domain-containing protein [unclassified Variovorax]MDM0123402.1 DUF1289 domain-containing protein [Variovorax sp. J2L1-78]MDM0132461.1 DUF1289 domain-containing protein [Variovorax sp. J2L1-63]MDM0231006.1 DUF1289 domain-containing protein [Variovorax sp. J2R1-6]
MNPIDGTDLAQAATLAQRAVDVAGTPGDDVPSPCVSVCRMDAERVFCIGCLRTIPEIAGWSRADAASKRSVWRAIEVRASAQAGLLRSTGDVTP